jgi:hypothetical protein
MSSQTSSGFLATAVVVIAMTSAAEAGAMPVNLALGASTNGTSPGCGGRSYPADLGDGLTSYTDTWAHGVAFSGGNYPIYGPGGIRYAQINFGGMETFNEAVVWHHGDNHFLASTFFGVLEWCDMGDSGCSSSHDWPRFRLSPKRIGRAF